MDEMEDSLESSPLMKKTKRAKKRSIGSGSVSGPVAVRLWRNISFMSIAFGMYEPSTTLRETFKI
jgi:hypothetical protein